MKIRKIYSIVGIILMVLGFIAINKYTSGNGESEYRSPHYLRWITVNLWFLASYINKLFMFRNARSMVTSITAISSWIASFMLAHMWIEVITPNTVPLGIWGSILIFWFYGWLILDILDIFTPETATISRLIKRSSNKPLTAPINEHIQRSQKTNNKTNAIEYKDNITNEEDSKLYLGP